jgi:methionine-rich copper-binding protein CopC
MATRLLLATAVLALVSTQALAHARLTQSSPRAGAVLKAGPSEIRLQFDDELDDWKSSIALFDSQGRAISIGRTRLIGRPPTGLSAPVAGRLRPGAYKVKWQASSVDGHASHGELGFTVRP